MKKIFLIALVLLTLLLSGCASNENNKFKGIDFAELPAHCVEFKDDVCGAYDCLVDQCWCDEGAPPGPVLFEGSKVVSNKEQAMQAVRNYITTTGENVQIQRAVKASSNNIFYTVFGDLDGDEVVYTVAVDGTIFKTICGV